MARQTLKTTSFPIKSVIHRRVNESVALQIRQAIFDRRLAPGQKLPPERELAVRFQTSRVALREALRALEKEGLITIKRGFGGGAFVANFDAALRALTDSLHRVVRLGRAKSAQLSEVRALLEPFIAGLASQRATVEDLEAIEGVVMAQEQELRTGDLSRKLDMEFHRRLAAAAHNPVLKIVIHGVNEAMRGPISRSKLSGNMRTRVVQYHRRIVDAIRRRDELLAQQIMSEHVADVQCHIEDSEHEHDHSTAV